MFLFTLGVMTGVACTVLLHQWWTGALDNRTRQ